jgi:DNA mismatch endonuclease, patch repair protein
MLPGPPAVPELWREPFASSEAVRVRMSRQRREGTTPELALRHALHSLGLRYRLHRAPLLGLRRKADIVFRPARVAVFVDGCFWHGCPVHGRRRHDVNSWYWPAKIDRNRRRDVDTDEALTSAGWLVVRVWEHELEGIGALAVAERVREALSDRRRHFSALNSKGRPEPAERSRKQEGFSPAGLATLEALRPKGRSPRLWLRCGSHPEE